MKKFLAIVLTLVMLLSFAACAGKPAETAAAKPEAAAEPAKAEAAAAPAAEKYTIAYCNLADSDVNCKATKEFFEQYAAEYPDVEVIYYDANSSLETQLFNIETAIAQKVNCIVALPCDSEGLVPGVKAANDAGIPYISFRGTLGEGCEYVYVGSENIESGIQQGEYLAEALPENAETLFLTGTPGMQHTIDRLEGAKGVLAEKRPDVKVLAEQTANYVRDEGMQVMEDWIQTYPKFDAVVAANDEMAMGALEALKAAGRTDGVLIVGVDGNDDALAAIANGEMAMTSFQNGNAQAKACMEVAYKLCKGEACENLLVPYEPITIDNVKDYQK